MTAASTPEPVGTDQHRRDRFRALYDAVYDDLWRYIQRRAADQAEAHDTLAEVFLVAWRRFDDMPAGDEARPWLFGVARNQLRSGWRKRKRNADVVERIGREVGSSLPGVDHWIEATETAHLLEALHRLRESDREIIRLVAWEELSHREIAKVLDCSENAVAIRLHRARGRLSQALERLARSSAMTTSDARRDRS